MNTDNVNSQVDIFNEVFTECLDNCAPFVTKSFTQPPAPWLTNDIKEAIKSRNSMQANLKHDRSNIRLQEQYKAEKRRVKLLIQNSKKKYYKDKLHECKGNSKATWQTVREIIPKNVNNTLDSEYDNISEKAEEFNHFFANVGKKAFLESQEDSLNTTTAFDRPIDSDASENPKFRPSPVDIDTVISTFNQLRNTNACGSDGIPFRFLKDSLPVTIFYITIIVNTSIVTGLYPDPWKFPQVIPFHKSGDKDSVNNFRPISLLPIVSKILEKIVANQLMTFLESNKLLANNQHGFRSNLSTETALLKVTEQLYKNMDNKDISLLILLDLSKAFDSISHEILFKKFEKLRIDPFWFTDYLKNRRQAVRLGSVVP